MKKLFLPLLAGLFAWMPTGAQRITSLKDCLEKGLERNYSLRIVRNEQKISDNDATLANAGGVPTVDLSVGYNGTFDNTGTQNRATGSTTTSRNVLDHTFDAGLDVSWTIFDGFSIQATYDRLKELKRQGETNTRIAVEDFIANLTSEYYNFVQQRIRMNNFRYAVALSRERLRIVAERFIIGSSSRLDLKQASVDFNADSAECLKQKEALNTSRIRLNELMAVEEVNSLLEIRDTVISVSEELHFNELWNATLETNASLIKAEQNRTIAALDLKKAKSRDYPYIRLNTGYGYTFNRFGTGSTVKQNNWGLNFGVTVGFNLFDGNRRREMRNARLAVENADLERQDLLQSLRADFNDLWQAYQNNLKLLKLERNNLITARENHEIARERYLLGDLSGIEMREAQKSLLDQRFRVDHHSLYE